MKIYHVLVRRPLFNGGGYIRALNVTFRSKAIALKFARRKAAELKDKNHLIRVEEFILKKLDMDNLIYAFDSEDIIDLIDKRNEVKVFRNYVDTA